MMYTDKALSFKSLAFGVSTIALLAFSGSVSPVYAARCVTGIATTSTAVVDGINTETGSAITDVGLIKIPTNVINNVAQTKNPAIDVDLPGPLPVINVVPAGLVVVNVGSTTTPVLKDAALAKSPGDFLTSVTPTFTPVINSVTPLHSFSDHTGSTDSFACGQNANVSNSTGATAVGPESSASNALFSSAFGNHAEANDSVNSTAVGAYANASLSVGSTAIGAGADVRGTSLATANGYNAKVEENTSGGTAIGANAYAGGNGSTALGVNATASAPGSSAIGAGANTNTPLEMMLGTSANTYTAPGITSGLSRYRQSGPLEVVTSDADGHLATDGGAIFREFGRHSAGIAIATALENPDLVGHETFGLTANVGYFEGSTALAVSAMGVFGHDLIGAGERWAVSGGLGVSLNERDFAGQNTNRAVAGRAGVQVTW